MFIIVVIVLIIKKKNNHRTNVIPSDLSITNPVYDSTLTRHEMYQDISPRNSMYQDVDKAYNNEYIQVLESDI